MPPGRGVEVSYERGTPVALSVTLFCILCLRNGIEGQGSRVCQGGTGRLREAREAARDCPPLPLPLPLLLLPLLYRLLCLNRFRGQGSECGSR